MTMRTIFTAAVAFSLTLVGASTASTPFGVSEAEANPLRDIGGGTTDGLARADSGLFYGFTMGRGSLGVSCDECRERPALSEGLSLTGHAGLKLGRRLGIYGEYWMIRWRDRDGDWFNDADIHSITQQTISAGAQLWLTRRLFVRASLGYSRHSTDIDYTKREDILFAAAGEESPAPEINNGEGGSNSVATTVGAGFELIRTKTFGLSAEARIARNRLDDKDRDVTSFAASIGLSWF